MPACCDGVLAAAAHWSLTSRRWLRGCYAQRVVGDWTYGPRDGRESERRMMLHAWKLELPFETVRVWYRGQGVRSHAAVKLLLPVPNCLRLVRVAVHASFARQIKSNKKRGGRTRLLFETPDPFVDEAGGVCEGTGFRPGPLVERSATDLNQWWATLTCNRATGAGTAAPDVS